jgi:Predicted ATPase (AAA+ superfamily)
MDYRKRLIDSELSSALETSGAVLLEGARGCGKTSSALNLAASSVRLDLDARIREMASFAPEILLTGETPRLIDEWQLVPEVFNQIRAEVDSRQEVGQFVLTGSSKPIDTKGIHPGSHRF